MRPVAAIKGWSPPAKILLCLIGLLAVDGPRLVASRTYEEHREKVALPGRSVTLTCATPLPARAAPFLVLFASGDGGLHWTSKTIYQHMAEQGHYVAAFSSGEVLADAKRSDAGMTVTEFSADISVLAREGKRIVGLSESTPVVVAGLSRGASMVVLAGAQPALQSGLAGGVAIALTRESDYGKAPRAAPGEVGIQLDARGRILIYPLIDRMGPVPLAVVQSTRDQYVPAAESRGLMGPDTATRRLYTVEARNHSFGGATDEMLRDVDAALAWIAAQPRR